MTCVAYLCYKESILSCIYKYINVYIVKTQYF